MIYDLWFYFIILLKYLIGILFIDILLLFLYEVDSYELRVKLMSWVYKILISICKFLSLIMLLINFNQ